MVPHGTSWFPSALLSPRHMHYNLKSQGSHPYDHFQTQSETLFKRQYIAYEYNEEIEVVRNVVAQ